jgi:MFS family permease
MGHVMSEIADAHGRRNTFLLTSDWVSVGMAMSFVSSSTVLPALVSRLSDLPVLVGLISTIGSGGWLLPQLISASRIGHFRWKKRFIILPGLIGRPTFWLTAVVLLLAGARNPALVLAVFFLGFTLFNICDGFGAVAWFDLLSKCIPVQRRGRVIGIMQLVTAVAGMGIGLLVEYLLGESSPLAFPANYASLFLISGVFMAVSTLSISQIHEPEGVEPPPRASFSGFIRRLKTVWRTDPDFRKLTLLRLSLGTSTMAVPFFVVYATKEVGLGMGAVGVFLAAQVAGGLAGSVGLAFVSERMGSRKATIIETVLVVAISVWALATPALAAMYPGSFTGLFALVFVLIGACGSAFMLGHMNYLMEMSPASERVTYVGLSNTITGLLMVTPLIAGWIVEAASYQTLFVVSALTGIPAVFVGLRLREPRRAAEARTSDGATP